MKKYKKHHKKYYIGQILYVKNDYLGIPSNSPVQVVNVHKKGRYARVDIKYQGVTIPERSVKKFRIKPR